MIEITDATTLYGYWFVNCPPMGTNFMGVLYRDGDGPLQAVFRTREKRDEKAFDSDDVKLWYRMDPPKDMDDAEARAKVVAKMRFLCAYWSGLGGEPIDEWIGEATGEEASAVILSREHTHVRFENPGDAEA